jgi:hypothetical protein
MALSSAKVVQLQHAVQLPRGNLPELVMHFLGGALKVALVEAFHEPGWLRDG